MSDSSFTRVIYTELDSLYDTKISTLNIIDPRLATEYLFKNYKIPNQILYMTNSSYKEIYKYRDKRVLKASKATAIIDLIRAITSDIEINNKLGTAITTKTKLIINTYPYKLDEIEKADISEFFKLLVLNVDSVEVVDISDLNSIVDKLSIIIKNDGLEWFFNNKLKNPDYRISHITLIIPDVITDKNPTDAVKMKEYLTTTFLDSVKFDFIEEEAFRMKLIDTPN